VLVTWDGFYLRDEWRKAPNIFRRGDQSNCLMFDRHHEIYEASTPQQKIRLGPELPMETSWNITAARFNRESTDGFKSRG
jgi:hypothetical protein